MRYKVIEHFCDMQDNGHSYEVGDSYPRNGLSVSESRYRALATMSNALGRPLIKEDVEKEVEPVAVEEPDTEPIPDSTPKSRGRKKKE